MKIYHLLPVLAIALSACTTPAQAPQDASSAGAIPEAIKAKNVVCTHVNPAALAAYEQCAEPADAAQTAEVLCADILPEFVTLYQACRAASLGGITFSRAAPAPGTAPVPVSLDGSVTSYSGTEGSSVISTTTSNQDGVRSVSVTINGVTHTLSSDTEPTALPDWPASNLSNP